MYCLISWVPTFHTNCYFRNKIQTVWANCQLRNQTRSTKKEKREERSDTCLTRPQTAPEHKDSANTAIFVSHKSRLVQLIKVTVLAQSSSFSSVLSTISMLCRHESGRCHYFLPFLTNLFFFFLFTFLGFPFTSIKRKKSQ